MINTPLTGLSAEVSGDKETRDFRSSVELSGSSAGRGVVPLSVVLFLIAIACYFPSLWAGFAGDDYLGYSYFFRALNSDPWSLVVNLVAPWMSCATQELHYRPLMLVPHLFDCLLWRFNPIGFHLTNLVIHAGCTVLVFLIARKLVDSFSLTGGITVPLLSGVLFAVHPLHAEAVSWVTGRVDSFCALLLFLSLYLFLKAIESPGRPPILMIGSCICAFASMMCKETGAVLPAVLTLYCLCKDTPSPSTSNAGLTRSFKRAIEVTWPFWAILCLYLCARTAALGTLVGGYSGMTAVLFETTWQWRLFRVESYEKLLFPVPIEMKQATNFYSLALFWLCGLMTSIGVVKMWLGKSQPNFWRAGIFLSGWLLLQFAVVSRVWNPTVGLAGGRQFYLLSAPFFILLTLLLIPTGRGNRILPLCGSTLFVLYCAVLATITFQQNTYWKEMSDYSREFQKAMTTYLKGSNWTGQVQVANVPVTHRHLSMIHSVEVLKALFSAPFCTPEVSSRIGSLEPFFYNVNLMNKTMLSLSMANPSTQVVCWNDVAKTVRPLSFVPGNGAKTSCSLKLISERADQVTYAVTPLRPISKAAVDCLEVTVSSTCAKDDAESQNTVLFASWTDCLGAGERERVQGTLWEVAQKDGSERLVRIDSEERLSSSLGTILDAEPVKKYRLHLSQVSGWVLGGDLSSLQLAISPPTTKFKVESARLVNLTDEIPVVTLSSEHWSPNGDGTYAPLGNKDYVFDFDASRLASGERVVAEVSLPDQYWYHFESSYRQSKLSNRRLCSVSIKGKSGKFQLSRNLFPQSADYQIRIAALRSDGAVAGYVSDPVTIRVQAKKSL